MKHVLMALSVFILGSNVFAVTGHSVTTFYRYAGSPALPENNLPTGVDPWGTLLIEAGALGRFDIAGNSISVDTIIKRTTFFCQFPVMSLDGTRVAFFRWPYRLAGSALQKIPNDTACISIIDIGGKNCKDLVKLPANPGFENHLAWPADGWIYYVRPRTPSADGFDRVGNEIWKVNPFGNNPASTNIKVMAIPTCAYIHRFNVDQAVDKYSLMAYPIPTQLGQNCAGDHWDGASPTWQAVHNSLGGVGGCNDKISPSGGFIGGFCNTNHTLVCMAGWDGSRYIENFPNGYGQSHSESCMASTWSGFSMNNSAVGSRYFTWSCNSDKWYCHGLYWHYCCNFRGSNQLIVNWVDKQAVMTSRNPDVAGDPNGSGAADNTSRYPAPGLIAYNASWGDFWEKPPSAQYDYAYEDTTGAWRQMTKPAGWTPGDTSDPTSAFERSGMFGSSHYILTTRHSAAGQVRIDLPDGRPYAVSIIDMRGRTVLAQSAHASVMIHAETLDAGIYLVRAARPGLVLTSKFNVAQ